MKILYLGQISPGQTALMRMRALERLGHAVHGIHTAEPWTRAPWIKRQLQRRMNRGSIVDEINATVFSAARRLKPELVWADKQEFLRAETIVTLRKLGARLVHFTPDPYFTVKWKRTRIMDEAIREFDVLVYCKSYERINYEGIGKPIVYMPLGYCDETHRPLVANDSRWSCSVGFSGGWEPRREQMLHAIARAGADLKFRGPYWDFLRDGKWTFRRHLILRQNAPGERVRIHRDELLAPLWQGNEVYGDDYARALSGAGIGVGFLRTAWPDQHTTRTFEIPACGSMLLAERTDEHMGFFKEHEEAEFFASTEELLEKVRFYSANESDRKRIAENGYTHCINGKYAYIYRLHAALEAVCRN
jgi:spore maturation protein CgeB